MVRNATKHEFRVQWGGLGAFIAKKIRLDFVARTFALVRPNSPEGNQTVRNAAKRQFRVQRGGSGAFVAKNSDATRWHEHFATKAPDPPRWTLNSCFVAFRTI